MKILGELTKGMHLGTHFAHVDTSLYCQLSFYNAASFPGSCAWVDNHQELGTSLFTMMLKYFDEPTYILAVVAAFLLVDDAN